MYIVYWILRIYHTAVILHYSAGAYYSRLYSNGGGGGGEEGITHDDMIPTTRYNRPDFVFIIYSFEDRR